MRNGALFQTAAQAAEAEAVFKNVLLEIRRIVQSSIRNDPRNRPEDSL
jgi:hypothetical protein